MAIETLTDIANLALSKIGYGHSISDIDTPSSPSDKIKIALQGVIESVQREFWWQELMVEVALSADATTREDGRFEYSVPLDLLRLYEVDACDQWEIFGDKFITGQEAPLSIKYLKRSENVGEWSGGLKECVYTLLASEIATPLGIPMQAEKQLSIYEGKVLPRAKTQQSKDNGPPKERTPYQGSWLRTHRANK